MLENLVNEFNSKSLFLNRSSFFPQILFLKLIETFFKERVIFPQELPITRNFPEVSLSNSYGVGIFLMGKGAGRSFIVASNKDLGVNRDVSLSLLIRLCHGIAILKMT